MKFTWGFWQRHLYFTYCAGTKMKEVDSGVGQGSIYLQVRDHLCYGGGEASGGWGGVQTHCPKKLFDSIWKNLLLSYHCTAIMWYVISLIQIADPATAWRIPCPVVSSSSNRSCYLSAWSDMICLCACQTRWSLTNISMFFFSPWWTAPWPSPETWLSGKLNTTKHNRDWRGKYNAKNLVKIFFNF